MTLDFRENSYFSMFIDDIIRYTKLYIKIQKSNLFKYLNKFYSKIIFEPNSYN